MPADEQYRRQARLLMRVLPSVADETCFALKGGTAINLFVRDLPRLSVDIDLTYLPVAGRDESLRDIDVALRRVAEGIGRTLRGVRVQPGALREEHAVNKLFVRDGRVQVKIEVTPVLRGCVYEPEEHGIARSRAAVRLRRDQGGVLRGSVRRQAGGGARSPASARPVRCPRIAGEGRLGRSLAHCLCRLPDRP